MSAGKRDECMSWKTIGLIWHLSSFDLLRDSTLSCSCRKKRRLPSRHGKLTVRPVKTSTSCAVFGRRKIQAHHDNKQSFPERSRYLREVAFFLVVLGGQNSPRRFTCRKASVRDNTVRNRSGNFSHLGNRYQTTECECVSVNGGPKTRAECGGGVR